MSNQMWMVRAGEKSRFFDDFQEKNIVAIGWSELGDLENYKTRDQIFSACQKMWPHAKKMSQAASASQIYRFKTVIKVNDRVMTYDSSKRIYTIGTIQSEYKYKPDIIPDYPNYREVKWEGTINRDKLSKSTLSILGSISTLFLLQSNASKEIENTLKGKSIKAAEDETLEEDTPLKDIQEQSNEFIKDKISKLDWEEMQELVAGLLRAMNYKTQVSPFGPDLGKDIVASPDGFGFEQPRIVVEVKHRNSAIGAQDIRSFLGGRHKDDKGLYVSTGGFTKDAKYEADRASIPITLMDLDDLVTAIIEYYEKMDVETKLLLPLRKIYWPK